MAEVSVLNVNGTPYTIKDSTARSDLSGKAPIASPNFTGTPTVPTPDTSSNSEQIPNTSWVKARISDALSGADAMVFKGTIGNSTATITTKTLPNSTAKTGWTYKAAEAGNYTVGTGSGTGTTTVPCEAGDMIIAITNGSSSTYATWVVAQANIDGAVTGPASSTADHVATFNGTTGKVIKDSGYTIGKSVPSDAVFTDHTYTNGTGLSLSGSTFNHSNSVTAGNCNPSVNSSNQLVVGGISYDAQGHATSKTTKTIKINAPTITVTKSEASTLTSVNSAGTVPSWSYDSANEKLTFSAGAMPTFNTGNRMTGIASASSTAPTFAEVT